MKTVRTIPDLRAALKAGPRPVGLVPTMGALHDGHLSLIERAAAENDQVVVSIFVNPSQFNEATDFERYPRAERRDAELAAAAGATLLFAPQPDEIYPPGFSTSVQVTGPLTDSLEGAHRGAAHFHGVTTVVTKLLNMVAPDAAYFGQKDAQQALVIRRLVADLNLDVRIEILPTVREPSGLALSSRNEHLSEAERERAHALIAALETAREAAKRSTDPADIRAAALDSLQQSDVELEYFELVDPDDFSAVSRFNGSGALAAIAARVGETRLIDNLLISPSGEPEDQPKDS